MFAVFRDWLDRYFSDPQLVMLGVILAVGFGLIYLLGNMLAPLFASLIIAYLLDGMVAFLQKYKMPRFPAVIVVFLLFVTAVVITLVVLLPMLSNQITQLIQDLPVMLNSGMQQIMKLPERFSGVISENQLRDFLRSATSEITSNLQEVVKRLFSISLASLRGVITTVVYLILVPLMVFFFLKDKEMIIGWLKRLLPSESRLASQVWGEVNQQIGNYVRGKIWEIFIIWGVTYATFRLLHLDFTMLLSLFVGLSVLIPYIGATVMTLPVALIAYFQWGWGSEFVTTIIAYAIIQALDGNLLVPLLLSGVVDLHPVAIIAALLVFGGLWGIWGLFFAIPLATLVHSVLKVWLNQQPLLGERVSD